MYLRLMQKYGKISSPSARPRGINCSYSPYIAGRSASGFTRGVFYTQKRCIEGMIPPVSRLPCGSMRSFLQ